MAKLEDKLVALATLSPAQLREDWLRLIKTEPPRLSADLLRHAIGYELQARHYGKRSVMQQASRASPIKSDVPKLKPGTRLFRSWHGRSIAVVVTDQGYFYNDHTYRSLTAIAREVTGAAWSGPRFFGLRAADHG